MLKCLKSLADWEPVYVEELEKEIWQNMADGAGVDLETLNSAIGIVKFDGWFGPYTDEDYEQEGHKITKNRALEIVEMARDVRFSDVEYQDPDYPCDCGEYDCDGTTAVIEGKEIYNEIWKWYREIYG